MDRRYVLIAYKYEIPQLYNGKYYPIFEFYIPSCGIYFNQSGAIFRWSEDRFKKMKFFEEKDVNESLVDLLVQYLALVDKMSVPLQSLLSLELHF